MEGEVIAVGIDVSKRKLDVAVLFPDGRFRSKVVSNSVGGFEELRLWLGKQGVERAHVCMEATGIYWEGVAEYFFDRGFVVSVVNPFQVKAFGGSRLARAKTDRVDARLIAEFCATQRPEPWSAPAVEVRELRALVLRREALVRMRSQEENRLCVAQGCVRGNIEAHIEHLDRSIREVEKEIKRHIDRYPHLRKQRDLLRSIPSFGDVSVWTVLAFFGGEDMRFRKPRQAVAFVGLDPREHTSGTTVRRKARLSKVGHCVVRRVLYFPAVTALNRTDWGIAFRRRLEGAGKPPKVIIAAMMRKLVHIAIGVLKSAQPFNPAFHYQGAHSP
jgi:transposase